MWQLIFVVTPSCTMESAWQNCHKLQGPSIGMHQLRARCIQKFVSETCQHSFDESSWWRKASRCIRLSTWIPAVDKVLTDQEGRCCCDWCCHRCSTHECELKAITTLGSWTPTAKWNSYATLLKQDAVQDLNVRNEILMAAHSQWDALGWLSCVLPGLLLPSRSKTTHHHDQILLTCNEDRECHHIAGLAVSGSLAINLVSDRS